MNILERYLAKTTILYSTYCLILLTGLAGLIKFVEQLRLVGRGDITVVDILLFVFFMIPRDFELFLPMSILLGSLIGLGILSSNSELTIIQVSGVSKFRISLSILKMAIPLMILSLIITEYVAPVSEAIAKNIKMQKLYDKQIISSVNGIWTLDNGNIIHIDQALNNEVLKNITIYQFEHNSSHISTLIHSPKAEYHFENGQEMWLLNTVTITHFTEKEIHIEQKNQMKINSTLTPDKLEIVSIKPEELSIKGLMQYITFLKKNKQNSDYYELAFWKKVFSPISIIVMMILALSFIFGPLRSVTMGTRIVSGIMIGFTFFIINESFGAIALIFHINLIIGILLPNLLFFLLAVFLMHRV